MAEILSFTVPPECDNMQLKRFLKSRCGISTRMITCLKREKDGILMDGKNLRSIDPVSAGAVVTVAIPREDSSLIEPVPGELDVVYEDAHLLVVNKPPYMPVHPVKQHQTDTLANIAVYRMEQKGESGVFRALNRLDRNTSGLVMLCKNKFAINSLKNSVKKHYTALAHGMIEGGGVIDSPIGLRDGSKIVREVRADGAPSITHYRAVARFDGFTELDLWLETGRTHQIRCHMSSVGHPLLGDDLYGGSTDLITRQALHCAKMEFNHPVTGEKICLSTELPPDMHKLIDEKKHR